MELFKELFSSLNRASVKYMVVGGIAVNLYGIERATADVDIILELGKGNVSRFLKVAKKLGLKPKIPVKVEEFIDPAKRKSWRMDKGMIVFSLYDPKNPFFLIDILTEIPFDFDEVYKQRRRIKLKDTTLPVVPIKELIAMKEKTGRPQDRADVYYLKKIVNEWKDEK